jgi:hypothetical protein
MFPSGMRLVGFTLALIAGALQLNCMGASGSPAPDAPTKKANAESADDESDSAEQNETKASEKSATTTGIPTECAQQGKFCAPPADFVGRLCADKFPSLALIMFRKGTPWTRRYVKLPQVEPRNTAGGPSSDAKLTAGEEVLILKKHGGGGGVEVSGSSDYDALRWDGSCASLSDLEIAAQPPGMTKSAPIVWKFLESGTQTALEQDAAVGKARDAWGKTCGGKAAGGGRGCDQATKNLTSAIASAVRSGLELPAPERIP